MTKYGTDVFLDVSSELLRRGCAVRFRAEGRSMFPTLREGELIEVQPIEATSLRVNDIGVYRKENGVIAHRVVAIEKSAEDAMFINLRGDNSTSCDQPVEAGQILGKVVAVERDGRWIDVDSVPAKLVHRMRSHTSGVRAFARSLRRAGGWAAMWAIAVAGSMLVSSQPLAAQQLLHLGTYLGDGTDNRAITGVGFQADFIIVKGNAANAEGVMRTVTMGAGDISKLLGSKKVFQTDRIQSIDADGFTIGTNNDVNGVGITYHFMAYDNIAGTNNMLTGSYTGDGTADRDIEVGLTESLPSTTPSAPDYVIVIGNVAADTVHRISTMTGTDSFPFNGNAITDAIIDIPAPGDCATAGSCFTVGAGEEVNTLDKTYHWIAWRSDTIAPAFIVGAYDGNAVDDRDITTVDGIPQWERKIPI